MSKWPRAASYIATKLAAAGVVFLGFLLIVGGFDPYSMTEITKQFPLWGYIYGYAVLYAAGVDAALLKLKAGSVKTMLTIALFVLGGSLPFNLMFPGNWILILFASFYGIACALVFLLTSNLLRRSWPYNASAAIILLAAAIYISYADFTVTKGWTETRTSNGYQAEFDYFHGQKSIPVPLEAGQTLSYRVDWKISGGYGTSLKAEGGSYTSKATELGEWISYEVDKPSTVQIIVTGDHAQGSFQVEWEILGD